MVTISQTPAALALTGVGGNPFSIAVQFVEIVTNTGASVDWSAVSNPVVIVTDMYGNAIPVAPSLTVPEDYVLLLAFTADQTSFISNYQSARYALEITITGVGPYSLMGGALTFPPPTYGSNAMATTQASLATNMVALTVQLGGGTGVTNIASPDGSIVITEEAGPTVEISALAVAQAASVSAVGVSEAYALTTAQAASVNAVNVSEILAVEAADTAQQNAETYAFTITNAASVTTLAAAESYANAASVNAALVSDPRGYAATASVGAENYAFGITNAASVLAISTSEAYATGITSAASTAAIATSEAYALTQAQAASVGAETYAFGITQAASVNAEAYALTQAHAASVTAAAVSDPLGYASAASVAAINVSEVYTNLEVAAAEQYNFGLTQAASVATEAYALSVAQSASINAAALSDPRGYASAASTAAIAASFLTTQSASIATLSAAESYALTEAQAASVNAALVSDPRGYASAASTAAIASSFLTTQSASTAAIQNATLAACLTVSTASVSTSAPGALTANGATASVGSVILLTAQPNGAQNGPFVYNGASVAMTRPTDYATGASVLSRTVQVTSGTYANNEWMMGNTSTVIVDTTATTWTQGYSGTYAPLPSGPPAVGDSLIVTQDSPLTLGYEAILSFTAAGQLPVGTGSGTGELLSKGSNGQVLTVGGADPSGLEWSTPSAPPSVATLPLQQPNSGSGNILSLPYGGSNNGGNLGSTTPTNGVMYYYPLVLNDTAEVIALSCRTFTGGGAGALLRFGIFNDSGGQPGTVILDAGTADATGGYANITVSLTQSLTSGRYWVGVAVQGAPSPTPQLQCMQGAYTLPTGFASSLTNALSGSTNVGVGFTQTGVTGALSTAASLSLLFGSVNANYPIIAVSFN